MDAINYEDKEAFNEHFNGLLRACFELAYETKFVYEKVASHCPTKWSIMPLWCSVVAKVTIKQIYMFIDGPEGGRITDLSIGQIFDLVTSIEHFREIVEQYVPNLYQHHKKIVEKKDDDDGDDDEDDVALVKEVSDLISQLWDVHTLSQDEFFYRSREQNDEILDAVYS